MGLWRGAFIIPRPSPGEDAGGSKGAAARMERLRPGRLRRGRVSAASRRVQPPSLQAAPRRGLARRLCRSPRRAAAPSPRQLGASPPLPGSLRGRSHVLHMSRSWRAERLFQPPLIWRLRDWMRSQGPLAAGALPGVAGAHDAAPALEPSLSPSRPSSSGMSLLLLCPSLTWSGRSLRGRAVPSRSRSRRAGDCPAAVVLLHLGAPSEDWSRSAALPPLPCTGTASSHVNG